MTGAEDRVGATVLSGVGGVGGGMCVCVCVCVCVILQISFSFFLFFCRKFFQILINSSMNRAV